MKKFLCLLTVVLLIGSSMVSCTSCSNDVKFGIEYSLQSEGLANGNVNVTFDNGFFDLNGQSNYTFAWQNTKMLNDANSALLLENALASKDLETLEAANNVNNWLDETIKVTSAGGTYDIHIKGYVKETATGLTFEIDRRFTNVE